MQQPKKPEQSCLIQPMTFPSECVTHTRQQEEDSDFNTFWALVVVSVIALFINGLANG